ncbi:MAG TPA: ABC transporter substrate-binding protein [Longimicrobiaceae bacterium]
MPRTARGLLAATVLLIWAGCGRDAASGGSGGDGDPVSGGTVVIAQNSDMAQPLATLSQGGLDATLQDVLYMGLLRGEWADGRVRYVTADESPMALARSYEYVAPDSTGIRFHMRSDVRWSDGTPITAHDVVFTYHMLRDPMVASPRQDYTEHIEEVVAEDDSTVLFRFRRRYPEMLFHSTHGIVPRHVYESVPPSELATHPSVRNPENGGLVVSGPYQIASWSRGQQVVLSRNPHFQPAGYLDQIVFRVIPDATTRIVELQTGTIDWVNGVGFEHVPMLRQQAPQIRFEMEEKRFYDYIAYNPNSFEAFADPEIRRALGMAINVEGILEALQMTEFAVRASGPYPPIFADLYDPQMTPLLPYDPDQAREILSRKGWVDNNGDGIVEKDGKPFRFTLVTNSGNQRRADVSQIVQQQWRQIGVDAQLRSLEFNTFMDALVREDYEAALGGWGVPLSADLTGMWSPESPFNIVSYANPEAQRLFELALAQPTEEAAIPYWKQAAAKLVEDQPYTWLFYMDQVNGINERVRGVKVNTFGPYQNAWEWWIPEDQQRGGFAPATTDTTE